MALSLRIAQRNNLGLFVKNLVQLDLPDQSDSISCDRLPNLYKEVEMLDLNEPYDHMFSILLVSVFKVMVV
jgi:hypothetical protein